MPLPKLLLLLALLAPQLGAPPSDTLGARDLAADYHLPPLANQPADPLYRAIAATQVLSRARRLGLTPGSGTDAWKQADLRYAHEFAAADKPFPAQPALFRGERASALNQLMAKPGPCAVHVVTPVLVLDQPIYPGDHCSLDLGDARLQTQGFQPYQIQIKARTDVLLQGGYLTGGQWGISVARSTQVTVRDVHMQALGGGGIMVTNSAQVTVAHNRFSALGGAAVMLHGQTQHTLVLENDMLADTGWSNWHAGIVITDRNADPADNATALLRTDGILVQQTRITDRLNIPHDNVILGNQIVGNKTSGIYSDGGVRNLILENTLRDNAKEGMCLDNGSTANVVAFNLFRGNGKRWGMSDADLKRDFVGSFGRLPDGTSAAKLPGISMDNSAYNQVLFNQVDHNFGSGIKMVRTSFFNRVGLNTLTDNNEGANPKLHYFGILIGYAGADESAWDLDFVPSHGNQIFANNIRGTHFAGIYFEAGADHNVVFDNSIFGATNWAMDNYHPQPQESFNNLSNLPLRNIDSGLDPHLLQLGKGQKD